MAPRTEFQSKFQIHGKSKKKLQETCTNPARLNGFPRYLGQSIGYKRTRKLISFLWPVFNREMGHWRSAIVVYAARTEQHLSFNSHNRPEEECQTLRWVSSGLRLVTKANAVTFSTHSGVLAAGQTRLLNSSRSRRRRWNSATRRNLKIILHISATRCFFATRNNF